jgi:hypothetical protein
MKAFKFIFCFLFLSISNISIAQTEVNENTWQNGDIIFIKNNQLANSQSSNNADKFNCVGVIFRENNHPMVYFGAEPLKKIPYSEFLNLAEGRKYSIKWLSESSLMTDEVINTMRTYATAKLGTPYDNNENLNNEELYNAEFVWKLYRGALGVNLCEPREKELTASGDNNKKFKPTKNKTSNLSNKFVSIMDIYKSILLE